MDAAVSYDVWGYSYNKPNVDLAAGHLLYGMGWGYDLLYNDLMPAERDKCLRDETGFERSSDLHRSYRSWCEKNGVRPESNALLSRYLVGIGFSKERTMVGRCFRGLRLREP